MSATDGDHIRAAERQVRALEYRKAGASLREVARLLTAQGFPCSHEQVRLDIKAALDDLHGDALEEATENRKLELERMDSLTIKLWKRITDDSSDDAAIQSYLKVSERRARLLGIDAPDKHEHSAQGGVPLPAALGSALGKVYGNKPGGTD